jgi:hypothetical protein
MTRRLAAFGRFWWEFVVGDDWVGAAGIALGIGATALLAAAGVAAWWFMPLVAMLVLYVMLRRAASS